MFTYKARKILDQNSGWWVVTYPEFIGRILSFLLFEVYDNLHISAISPDTCRLARDLILEPILGSMANVTEEMRIIGFFEATRFDTLPER